MLTASPGARSAARLVVVVKRGDIEVLFGDPLAMWKAWTEDLRGNCVESGPQIAEENPDALVAALTEFLGDSPQEAARHERQANSGKILRVWAWTQHSESI